MEGSRALVRRAILLAALLASLWPAPASAEPYLAVRAGMKCSRCHANITGGGKRSLGGQIYTEMSLAMEDWSPWEDLSSGEGEENLFESISGDLSKYISLGADFGVENVTTVQPRSLAVPARNTNEFVIEEALLYIEAQLVPERAVLYFDTRFAPGAVTAREAFGLVKDLPFESYIKVGRFFQPYGLRIEDDSAFIRSQTGMNFNASDIGVEIGLEPGPIRAVFAAANGTNGLGDVNIDKRLTGLLSAVFRYGRLGVSGSYNQNPGNNRTMMWNVFGGATYSIFTLLGEFDHIRTETTATKVDAIVGFAELNTEILQGLNAKATYEFFDPDVNVTDNVRTRWSLVAEVFPTSWSQVRAGARIGDGPVPIPVARLKEYFVELRLFF